MAEGKVDFLAGNASVRVASVASVASGFFYKLTGKVWKPTLVRIMTQRE